MSDEKLAERVEEVTTFDEANEESIPKSHKYTKTAALCLTLLNFGLQNEILGPTLPSLVDQTKSTIEMMGLSLSIKSMGLFFGSLIGGSICDRLYLHKDLVISISLLSTGTCYILVPLCSSLALLSTILFFIGLFHSILITNCNVQLARLWYSDTGPGFTIMTAGFGVGSLMASLIVQPFVIHKSLVKVHDIDPTIMVGPPFGFVAGIAFIGTVWFFVHWMMRHKEPEFLLKPPECAKTIDENSNCCVKLIQSFLPKLNIERGMFSLIILIPLMTFTLIGIERSMGNFLFSFLVKSSYHFEPRMALILNSLFWVSFTAGRLVFFGLNFCLEVLLLYGASVVSSLTAIVVITMLPNVPIALAVLLNLFAFFFGAIQPCMLGSFSQVLQITGLIAMLIECGGSLGCMTMNNLSGFILGVYDPDFFPALTLCITVIHAILGMAAMIIIYKKLRQ